MNKKIEEAIDFVVTWVDGLDPHWLQEKERYKSNIYMDDSMVRYRDFGTLRYLLRSIEKFAPWVRTIFLVTNGQVPKWLDFDNPKLKIVKHADFIPEKYLPTFNPQTIEWHLHKIQGLSENFVYFNDDVILMDYVKPSDFFKNDMPCDTFGLGIVQPKTVFSRMFFNNICVLNKHFDFRDTLKSNHRKFFNFKYGKILFKTYILSKRKIFYGMYDPHITLSLKKNYFEILWKKERLLIEESCKNKFRSQSDITIWLVRYWQLLTGHFMPRSNNFGRLYSMDNFIQVKNIKNRLRKKKYKVICVNDNSQSDMAFDYKEKYFSNIMNNIFNEKSCFEK